MDIKSPSPLRSVSTLEEAAASADSTTVATAALAHPAEALTSTPNTTKIDPQPNVATLTMVATKDVGALAVTEIKIPEKTTMNLSAKSLENPESPNVLMTAPIVEKREDLEVAGMTAETTAEMTAETTATAGTTVTIETTATVETTVMRDPCVVTEAATVAEDTKTGLPEWNATEATTTTNAEALPLGAVPPCAEVLLP